MAIQEQVNILLQGTKTWNAWRALQLTLSIDLSNAYLSNVYLKEANLKEVNLSGAILIRADLRGANLNNIDLRGADLRGAVLNNSYLNNANLSGAHLGGATLRGATLKGTLLSEAILIGADLRGINLSRADLRNADLRKATLKETNLIEADLRGTNLSRADLRKANLRESHLSNADLSDAVVGQTIFIRLDLRLVKGLETIWHDGPSEISTSTIEKSHGEIPDRFLKGVGVSDTLIAYAHSLFRQSSEYYTCFLSYSSRDEAFVRQLHNDLQQEGVRCWFAPEDMNIGDKIRTRIDESIHVYDKLLLILSEHSIKSDWVAYEVEKALNKEPQGITNVLYPVRVDKTVLTCTESWAQEIEKTRHIGNFENWTDPEQYQESFKRLLRALNARKE